jgi:hypothetical protein
VQLARALVRALGRALGQALGQPARLVALSWSKLERAAAVLEAGGQAPRHPSRGLAGLGLGRRAPAPSAPCFSGFSMRLLLALLVRVCVIELLARRRTCAPRLCHAHGHAHGHSHTLTAGPASHRRARGCPPRRRSHGWSPGRRSPCRCLLSVATVLLCAATQCPPHAVCHTAPRSFVGLTAGWLSTG